MASSSSPISVQWASATTGTTADITWQPAARKKWAVVIPTNRREQIKAFWDDWKDKLQDCYVIIVHDAKTVPGWADQIPAEHHAWDTIGLEHAAKKSDMVRSWGIYRAWKLGSEYTLTLDDDVRPLEDDLPWAYEDVFKTGAPFSPYLNVGALTSYGKPLRGFPYDHRRNADVAVQYGGWRGVLDYDSPTQLAGVPDWASFEPIVLPVPAGAPVTGCIMNCAWRTKYAPIMWQLPLVDGKYNRFGDIWSCLFQKKVLDKLGKVMVVNGRAQVLHNRASDPVANCVKEAPGIPINETLWDNLECGGDTLIDTYRSVTGHAAAQFPDEYAEVFLEARDEWLALF